MFAQGDSVELKTGGSLGRWVPAHVLTVYDGRRARYDVRTTTGQTVPGVPERMLRRPRDAEPRPALVAVKAPKRKRVDVVVVDGRGPLRLPKYRQWVKGRPCIFCGAPADDPHHYGPAGMGQTTDDTRIVPVCRQGHDACHHRRPDELCNPVLYSSGNQELDWARVEATIYRAQMDLLTAFIREFGALQ